MINIKYKKINCPHQPPKYRTVIPSALAFSSTQKIFFMKHTRVYPNNLFYACICVCKRNKMR